MNNDKMTKEEIINKLEAMGMSYEVIRQGRIIQAPAWGERASESQLEELRKLGFTTSLSAGGTWRADS